MKTRNCDLPSCGKEYTYKLGSSKYCSGTCRAKASVLNGVAQPTDKETTDERITSVKRTAQTPVYDPSGTIISPQAQFMINQLEKESARWEKLYEEERGKKSKVKKELEKITKELTDLQKDNAISDATKPTGLNGIMESPGFAALAPYLGPLVQRFGERGIDLITGNGGKIAGAEETDVQESPIASIATWFSSLGESTKAQVLAFMKFLSTQDETSVARIMAQIQASGMMGYSARSAM